MRIIFVLLLVLLTGVQVLARTECNTVSQGYRFQDANADWKLAVEHTVKNCTSNNNTNDGECRYNLRCFGDGRFDFEQTYARCSTQSRTYLFLDASFDRKLVEEQVLTACTKHQNTENSECRYYLSCMAR